MVNNDPVKTRLRTRATVDTASWSESTYVCSDGTHKYQSPT